LGSASALDHGHVAVAVAVHDHDHDHDHDHVNDIDVDVDAVLWRPRSKLRSGTGARRMLDLRAMWRARPRRQDDRRESER